MTMTGEQAEAIRPEEIEAWTRASISAIRPWRDRKAVAFATDADWAGWRKTANLAIGWIGSQGAPSSGLLSLRGVGYPVAHGDSKHTRPQRLAGHGQMGREDRIWNYPYPLLCRPLRSIRQAPGDRRGEMLGCGTVNS